MNNEQELRFINENSLDGVFKAALIEHFPILYANECGILTSVLYKADDALDILRLVENLVPYLRVSQRAVIAERLQGSRTDAQLLADLLVVHPTAEPFPFPLTEDFIHPVGQKV